MSPSELNELFVPSEHVVPPNSTYEGAALGEWAARWWQWAFSFPDAESPVADSTGDKASAGQTGNVWFLAGSYHAHKMVRRTILPGGTSLFFPILNVIRTEAYEDEPYEDMVLRASESVLNATRLYASVDGIPIGRLEDHREMSPGCFDPFALRIAAPSTRGVTDGYWLMLRPLSEGLHVLKFGGVLHEDFEQNIQYLLTIEKRA